MAADTTTAATVDELFNFDSSGDEDPFADQTARKPRDDKAPSGPQAAKRKAGDDLVASLGLDEEVKITKKRKQIAKLDEARLLSTPGIPKLRSLARSGRLSKKLRLKGKGHEISDVGRLLSHYQLWLDDLYPRARFQDGLQLVEKAGHSRRMQVMRKEWIDEGKPGYLRMSEERKPADREAANAGSAEEVSAKDVVNNDKVDPDVDRTGDSLFVPDSRSMPGDTPEVTMPEDDELDALLAEQEAAPAARQTSVQKHLDDHDSEGEDDLDALLAEEETRRRPPPAHAPSSGPKPGSLARIDDEDADMDDLDALLAEQSTQRGPGTIIPNPGSRASDDVQAHGFSADNHHEEDLLSDDDDLDAFIAEHEAAQEVNAHSGSSGGDRAVDSLMREGEAEIDGADMFPSSPVRTSPRFQQVEPSRSSEMPAAQTVTDLVQSVTSPARASDDAIPGTGGSEDTTEAAIEDKEHDKEEDSQAVDASDMFPASPVESY